MAAWGNALGGWAHQKRVRGKFASAGVVHSSPSKAAAKAQYKSERKANAVAHRARVKGSVKARGRELGQIKSKRGRTIVGGVALMAAGKATGSNRIYSSGTVRLQRGTKISVGRTRQTAAWSAGLKRSRNKQAKARYKKSVKQAKQSAKQAKKNKRS